MYGKILQKLLQKFFLTMGRAPISAAEWSKLRRQAMELARKEEGIPSVTKNTTIQDLMTGPHISDGPKGQKLWDFSKDLPTRDVQSRTADIIPFPKGQRTSEGVMGLMKSRDVQLGKAPKTTQGILDAKKDRGILLRDADEDILRIKRENKEAVDRFRRKMNPDEPDKFQYGGIAPLIGEPSYAADFYDDRTPMKKGKKAKKKKKKKKIPEELKRILKMYPSMWRRRPHGKKRYEKELPEGILELLEKDPGFDREAFEDIYWAGKGHRWTDPNPFSEGLRGQYSEMTGDISLNLAPFGEEDYPHWKLKKPHLEATALKDIDKAKIALHELRHKNILEDRELFMTQPEWVQKQEGPGYLPKGGVTGHELYNRFLDQRYYPTEDDPGKYHPYFDKILKDHWEPHAKAYEDRARRRLEERRGEGIETLAAHGGRIGMGGGSIVKGGRWFLNNLRRALNDIEADKGFKNLTPERKEGLTSEIKNLIKSVEGGGPIPDEMIQTIRNDPKFATISKTRSTDPDLYEFEDLILNYGKKGDVVDEQVQILEKFDPKDRLPNQSGGPVDHDALVQMYLAEGLSYEEAVQAAQSAANLPWDTLKKAEGGRVSYSGGGKAGLPAITQGIPQGPMQGPQMPSPTPQPAGVPGVNLQQNQMDLMQQKMQQNPWMPNQMQQGIGGMQNPQYGGQLRMPFGLGGMSRRAFMKMMAGITGTGVAAGTGLLKLGTAAKVVPKVTETIVQSNAAGMPAWFPSLVKRVIKEGEDVTQTAATVERQTVHRATTPQGTPIEVTHDLTKGDVFVDIGEQTKHGWDSGRYGQPTRLVLKKGEWIEPDVSKSGKVQGKGQKTQDEFIVEEAEFTGGHPENVKFEESIQFKYGDHGSDFSEVERFAIGKNKDKKIIGKQADLDDTAEATAQSKADYDSEFASGGLARMLGE